MAAPVPKQDRSRGTAPLPVQVARVLSLQRKIGNRATAALLVAPRTSHTGPEAADPGPARAGSDRLAHELAVGAPARASTSSLAIQRLVKGRFMGGQAETGYGDLDSLCTAFEVTADDVVLGVSAQGVLPPLLGRVGDTNAQLKQVIGDATTSTTSSKVIVASRKDAQGVADQLWAAIEPIAGPRLSGLGWTTGGSERYLNALRAVLARIGRIRADMVGVDEWTEESSQMKARIEKLALAGKDLQGKAASVLAGKKGEAAIDEINKDSETFVAELWALEAASDLDLGLAGSSVDEDVETLARTERATLPQTEDTKGFYDIGGGEDDPMNVGDSYVATLACSLHALLAIKGGSWLGVDTPEDLHRVLRKTDLLKDYDDNRTAAKIRLFAGLRPMVVDAPDGVRDEMGPSYADKEITLGVYLDYWKARAKGETPGEETPSKASKKKAVSGGPKAKTPKSTTTRPETPPNFIADFMGEAHTFAAMWRGDHYERVDETGTIDFRKYRGNKLVTVWVI